MTAEGYLNRIDITKGFVEAHIEEDTFFQSLYDIIQTKQGEKPTYALFLECLITAIETPSTWTEEQIDEEFWQKEPIIVVPENDFDKLLFFVFAEACHFYKNSFEMHDKMMHFHNHSTYTPFNLVHLIYQTLPEFLEKPENQALFALSDARWTDFITLLKTLTNYQPLSRLYSFDGQSVLYCLLFHPKLDIPKEEIIGLAWINSKWQMVYDGRDGLDSIWNEAEKINYARELRYKIYPHTDVQILTESWGDYKEQLSASLRREIHQHIFIQLSYHFSEEEVKGLLKAAQIFDCAYPEARGIGNADGVFYDEYYLYTFWNQFYPYRHYFENFLGKYQIFDYEWIIVAQVLWQHNRWQNPFSEEAAEYFLGKAVQLNPTIPIQFINFKYYEKYGKTDHFALQSPLGMTYYYYAEFLYYQKEAYTEALVYYEKFVALEPQLLPNNVIPFDANFVERLIYPPSTQTALTQIAQIYLWQNNIEKAKEYLEKAIAIRENNYQTPYELWAEILEKEGNTAEAIKFYEKKIKAIEATQLPYYHGAKPMRFYPIYAPKEKGYKYLYHGTYYRTKIIYLNYFYSKIADLYEDVGQNKEAKKATQKAKVLAKITGN